jgi:hypothetical protein
MPIVTTELPIASKLPQTLYEGAFTLSPAGETALYLFIDKTWCANLCHMLGWSREIIHSLKSNWMLGLFMKKLRPDWLCGHAFQWDEKFGAYKVSSTDKMFSADRLIQLAQETQYMLEDADIHTDQWGATKHDEWLDRITDIVSSKANHPIVAELLKNKTPLELHTMLANHGNSIHHQEYPKK